MLNYSKDEINKRQRRRDSKNTVATATVTLGGVGVVVAISLIFLYLLYEVMPLFYPTKVDSLAQYPVPGDTHETLNITLEELLTSGVSISKSGTVYFFKPGTGKVTHRKQIPLPAGTKITSIYKTEPGRDPSAVKDKKLNTETYALGLSNGQVIFVQTYFNFEYDKNQKRIIHPKVAVVIRDKPFDTGIAQPATPAKADSTNSSTGAKTPPAAPTSPPATAVDKPAASIGGQAAAAGIGSKPTDGKDKADGNGQAIIKLAAEFGSDAITIVSLNAQGQLYFNRYEKSETMGGDISFEKSSKLLKDIKPDEIKQLILSKNLTNFYILNTDNSLTFYRFEYQTTPKLIQHFPTVTSAERVTAIQLLVGGESLIIGDSNGSISQWFQVRDKKTYKLKRIRSFQLTKAPITSIATEYSRKGFVAVDATGHLGIFHTTAGTKLKTKKIAKDLLKSVYIAPRNNAVLAVTGRNRVIAVMIENEHPEVSWSALVNKVHYEGHQVKKLLWQSSSGSDDSEPKYSLVPLTLGTLKAAFYAMIISIPLAVLGAIFTAHFMTPRMRRIVKPSIELMEALPTVIIGFLAGLWLAPLVADNLMGVFLLIVLIPLGIIIFGRLWDALPGSFRHLVPEGWEGAILIPVLILVGLINFYFIGPWIEQAFFGGSLSHYLSQAWDIPYRNRNSIVIGLAMGFAVVPTIFSITEDAIFGVPKHLTHGSLALGATPWQTMSRVVILTASPGIFSAIMIGFGRAVGETMIVLMAAGNTPVTDFSAFTGARTLSANIAVELPEAARHSTHFRILFLTALVLFVFTFFFNTLAEIVRQRLRNKYSNI